MPKQIKVCRVCGKEYEACRSIRTGSEVFNWREFACSPKCGEEYLEKILISRNKNNGAKPTRKTKLPAKSNLASSEAEVNHTADADNKMLAE